MFKIMMTCTVAASSQPLRANTLVAHGTAGSELGCCTSDIIKVASWCIMMLLRLAGPEASGPAEHGHLSQGRGAARHWDHHHGSGLDAGTSTRCCHPRAGGARGPAGQAQAEDVTVTVTAVRPQWAIGGNYRLQPMILIPGKSV